MKMYFVVNARMPNEKAHGIHIAKMCEAFIATGVDLTLVVPSRGKGDLQHMYSLSVPVPVRRLPVIDLQFLGPVGYGLTAVQFIASALAYLGFKILTGEDFVVYTVDMDQFSFAPLAWIPRPVFAEMHSIKRPGFLRRKFFNRAGVIATNQLIAEGLASTFLLPKERLHIEPNGVDEAMLQHTLSQREARIRLNVPPNEPFALYVGRIYPWKGLEILASTAPLSSLPLYLVGGTEEEYERVTGKGGEGLRFVGARTVDEIPLWLAAADVLLVLGTAHNEDSFRYTSPMKIFEYFAARRPMVASRTPAIESIVPTDTAFWYKSDDARSLAEAIHQAHTSSEGEKKVAAGYTLASLHTWRCRAERITDFVKGATVKTYSLPTGALVVAGIALVLFFSSYQLFNSPETWMDEGLIIQSAIGLMYTGKAALPVAPGVFEPAWYITTGFPVTLPLAAVFSVFGVSLEGARFVMWVFLIGLYAAFAVYARKSIGGIAGWFGLFLLIFFGPLYGNGRNVLGEIPGLLFMMLSLLPLIHERVLTHKGALWVGVFAGLAFAAKPVFVLFLPALLLALLLRHKKLGLQKAFLFGVLGVVLPTLLWVYLQFDNVALGNVLAVYANPHEVSVGAAILANLKRVSTEMQPLYFALSLLIWSISYVRRRLRHKAVSLTEEALFFFTVLVFFAYLRTAGFYRYFFIGQVFTVLYLPQSFLEFVKGYGRRARSLVIVLLCGLLTFQAYETTFRSWTAIHYDSMRTEALERYFESRPLGEDVFVYQAPELAPFAWRHPLYQYGSVTAAIHFGEKNLPAFLSGAVPQVITSADYYGAHVTDVFAHYKLSESLDNYVILVPQKTKQ